MKCWVTMTDKCMSFHGDARGKINKLIFECDSIEEGEIVVENAQNRPDMKHINLCTTKPRFAPASKYHVQIKNKENYSYLPWYEKGYFKKPG